MQRYLALLCLSLSVLTSSLCNADAVRMEAVVDGKVITSLDVDRRMEINAFFYRTSHTASDREDVLQALVDEAVIECSANDLGLTVSDQEIDAEAGKMFSALGTCTELSLRECAAQNDLDYISVMSHVKSRVAWGKLLSAKVAPFLIVSEREIMDYVAEAESGGLETVLDLEQIFVPFKAGAVLDSVMSELRKGITLDKIAARYRDHGVYTDNTVGSSAGNFPPDVKSALVKAEIGEILDPIRTDRGYLIIKLLSRVRVARSFMNGVASIKQLSIAPGAEDDILKELRAHNANCDTFDSVVKDIKLEPTNLDVRIKDLSSRLQYMLGSAEIGQVLSTTSSDKEKVDLIMLCKISRGSGGLNDSDIYRIRHAAYSGKLVAASKRLMESMRRRHFIKRF